MSQLIQKAILRAIELHKKQVRKGSENIPYVVHPLEVAIILSRFTNDENLIVSALLHDTLEDCDYSKDSLIEEFGENVSYFVELLTEDKSINDYWERKTKGLDKVKENKTALAIKAIDSLVNMKDLIVSIKDRGEETWSLFNGAKEMKMDYFRIILDIAKEAMPAELLADYVSVLKDLEYSDKFTEGTSLGFRQ